MRISLKTILSVARDIFQSNFFEGTRGEVKDIGRLT